jgi:hypothetical protein
MLSNEWKYYITSETHFSLPPYIKKNEENIISLAELNVLNLALIKEKG